MKLVASAIVRNEAGRYLEPWLDHLLDFCDEVRVYDDGSRDGTGKLLERERVEVMTGVLDLSLFDQHEGKARQQLLEWTLEAEPSHILAIDADEFVNDGDRLRDLIEADRMTISWSPWMEEIWEVDGDCLCVRQDGGWAEHPVTAVWRVPPGARRQARWQIMQAPLACGRVPVGVRGLPGRSDPDLSLLHFGWTNEAQRRARYERYMTIDGGRFHQLSHLSSILTPPRLEGRPWPDVLLPYRERIEEATRR